VPNSRTALRLTELARVQGRHAATHDRLMQAYWEQALDIGDLEVLRSLAVELGLDGADAVLEGDRYGDEVQRASSDAQRLGIHAIPAFLLDRRALVLGAQADGVFEQAFAELRGAAVAPRRNP